MEAPAADGEQRVEPAGEPEAVGGTAVMDDVPEERRHLHEVRVLDVGG